MISKLKSSLAQNIVNMRGWKTNRKIVVFESDDWGSIRITNKESLNKLRKAGVKVDKCPYMLNDALEDNNDMESLFEVILSKKKSPVITANFLTANPDFSKIRESGFSEYFYESIEDSLLRYPNHHKVKEYWNTGMNTGFFIPQLHGREHLNISRWMSDLQNKNSETMTAFDLGIFGVSAHVVQQKRESYQAAFDSGLNNFPTNHTAIITDAVNQFQELFNFKPTTFIAPNYVWGEEVEKATSSLGIKHIQGVSAQKFPKNEKGEQSIKRNNLGFKNNYNQKYLIRNGAFEPFTNPNKDWVNSCMKDINNAFFWGKPSVISIHRVNFVGSINQKNREQNLKLFSLLVDKITKKWPDVEFMSSAQLAKFI